MTKQLNTLVSTALNAVGAYGKAVEGIKAALKGHTSPEEVRAALMVPVATYYGVKLVAKERGEGVTWDKDAAKFETAKKAHQRLCKDVAGKSTPQTPEFDVPAEVQALFDKAWAAAAKYESAGKIAATALATAKAK